MPTGERRLGGLDDMIISLYAGGMTIREIQHHLAATLGTELSHETISNITEAVMDEVTQWQDRSLEAFYPVIFLDAVVVKVRDQNRDGEPPRPHRGRSRYRGRSNTCWGSGSKPLRGAKFGASVWHPNWPTAASRTC